MTPATATAVEAAPARGRRRDDTRDPEILRATLDVLAESGYDRLTMDAVAARAKAGKATLYRRWEHKADLVADAVTAFESQCAVPVPDTGSLRGDLLGALEHIPSDGTDPRLCVMRGLISGLTDDARLQEAFRRTFVVRRQAEFARIFERAAARGELSERCDIQLLVDLAPAMVVFRLLLTSQPIDRTFVTSLVDDVILPLAAASRC